MNKALFWDFHGTLVQGNSLWSTSVVQALGERGYRAELEEVRRHMHLGYSWDRPEVDYVGRSAEQWWEELFSRFDQYYRKIGFSGDTTPLNRRARELILDPARHLLYADAEETLSRCARAGWRQYLLSNNFPELEEVTDKLGIGRFFSGYIVSACVGYEKPRPEIFSLALALAGQPDRAYMIGDSPIADIQGAKASGIPGILVHREGPSEAVYTVETLSEIFPLLE